MPAWRTSRSPSKRDLELRQYDAVPALSRVKTVNTLDVEGGVPLYHDIGQALKSPPPGKVAKRVHGHLAQMLAHRPHVRLVAMGDSRTAAGVKPELFYRGQGGANRWSYRVATGGVSVPTFELWVRHCVTNLPNLEWIVYNYSPRLASVGWADAQVAALPGPAWPDARGKTPSGDDANPTPIQLSPGAVARRDSDAYEYSVETWALFESTVRELNRRGIKMLVWTPPLRRDYTNRTLDDGTPHFVNRANVERLRSLTRLYPNFYFVDLHRGGDHNFADSEFSNGDHLNDKGAEKLTRLLEGHRKAPTWAQRITITQTSGDMKWQALRPGLKTYADRDYVYERIPERLRDLPALVTRNSDKSNHDLQISFHIDRPARIHIALHDDRRYRPSWLKPFEPADLAIETSAPELRLFSRDLPAGKVALGPSKVRLRSMYTVIVEPK
jgi:hypothetical protein